MKTRKRHGDFWSMVDIPRTGHIILGQADFGKCWPWRGSVNPGSGYGRICERYQTEYAHRRAYREFYDTDISGFDVLHRCDEKLCVNPAHLYLGNDLDNAADKLKRGRHRVACGESHPESKLTWRNVAVIRARYADGTISQAALAREYGVHPSTMQGVLARKTWVRLEQPALVSQLQASGTDDVTALDLGRFWGKVAVARVDDQFWEAALTDPCWLWSGAKGKNGHGYFGIHNTEVLVHRLMYRLFYSEDPGDQMVRHLCGIASCVNPFHLCLGTALDSHLDRVSRGTYRQPPPMRGESHPMAKINQSIADEIRMKHRELGHARNALAREYGLSSTNVGDILHDRIWCATAAKKELGGDAPSSE